MVVLFAFIVLLNLMFIVGVEMISRVPATWMLASKQGVTKFKYFLNTMKLFKMTGAYLKKFLESISCI